MRKEGRIVKRREVRREEVKERMKWERVKGRKGGRVETGGTGGERSIKKRYRERQMSYRRDGKRQRARGGEGAGKDALTQTLKG